MVNRIQLSRMVKQEIPDMLVKDIDRVIEATCSKIIELNDAGESIRIKNFAAIEPSKRSAHEGVDPSDPSKKLVVPEIRTVRFRPCSEWKKTLNPKDGE